MEPTRIGRFIAERRKALRLTQRQLAEQLLVSDKTVSKWETGVSHRSRYHARYNNTMLIQNHKR